MDTQQTNVSVKIPGDLTAPELSAWAQMRAQNPALYSPYFHSDYAQLIGSLRDDARVAILRDGGHPIAFLPFQGPIKGQGGFARPIGAPMTDYHGIICHPDAEFDPIELMQEAGIGAFHYSGLIDTSGDLSRFDQSQSLATVADISGGVEAWRGDRDSSYRRHLKSHRRRIRKAEDEIGPRRFVFMSRDRDIFDQLIDWKQAKFAETGKYDVLSAGWTLDLLERLWGTENVAEGDLRCDMQALYFGDRLAAVDLGLSDGVTFHSWIVAYDGALQSYAPGIQLLEGLFDASAELGYQRIDLGAGTDGYKRHYASEEMVVGSGFIAVSGPAATLSQLYGATERWGQKALKDAPGKLRRRYSQIAACDETLSGRAKAMFEAVTNRQK